MRVDGRWIIVVTARDVTERLRQQARMERFATALDLSEEAVFLVDRETMSFLDVNETACRLVGVPREKLLKRRPYDDLLGSGRAELEAQYDQLIAQSPAAETIERMVLRADGTQVPCELRRQALRASDGRWVIVANLRDITERKKATEQMELLATAMDLSDDGIVLIDRETMSYLAVNRGACKSHGIHARRVARPLTRHDRAQEPGGAHRAL